MNDPEVFKAKGCPVCGRDLMAEPTDHGWPDGEYVFCAGNCGCHGTVVHDDDGMAHFVVCEGIASALCNLDDERQRRIRIAQRIIEVIGSKGPEDAEQALERLIAAYLRQKTAITAPEKP